MGPAYPSTWVRLRREGDVFTGYASYDGVNWQQVSSTTLTAAADTVYLGMAASAHSSSAATTAQFAHFGKVFSVPSGWNTLGSGGRHLVTTMEVDGLGRTTKRTDPNGNVTYIVYNDGDHETRVYQGWDAATGAPTGPTRVYREDWAGGYTETLTMSAAPTVNSNGEPTGQEAVSDIQSLARDILNSAGQVIAHDDYFDLTGITYSASTATLGTQEANYYRTDYDYDERGRKEREEDPTGTITRLVYDGRDRLVSTWIGTDDTPDTGWWSPDHTTGTNLVMVSSNVYDNGGVGDGNLTRTVQYPNGSSNPRVTDYAYDWRDRLVASKQGVLLDGGGDLNPTGETDGVHRPITYYTLDNLGEIIRIDRYDGDGVSLTDANANGVPDAPSASLLRARSTMEYDNLGRVFASHTFSVDPSTGTVSSTSLNAANWYDHRGNLIKSVDPSGLVTKYRYDGANRQTGVFSTDGGGDSSWADAKTLTGDIVLQQTQTQLDDNGNPIFSATALRHHDATGTGELDSSDARIYYTGSYYDAADRKTADVNVGTNGGSAWSRPGTAPTRSDTVLVNSYTYNDAGWLEYLTDPKGIVNKTEYDLLGRTTKTIDNYTDGTPTDSTNQTTAYTYDGDNDILTQTAVLPDSAFQTTQYLYGSRTAPAAVATKDDGYPFTAWTSNTSVSRWISPHADQDAHREQPGVYDFKTSFDLSGYDAETASLTIHLAVDNGLGQLTAEY